MDEIAEFVDKQQKGWCIHCGGWIEALETSRDHVPSKALLLPPYPKNLPVIPVCRACNEGFSLDEEYLVAFLGCILAGSTDPAVQTNPNAKRILLRNSKLRVRIQESKAVNHTLDGGTRTVWTPEAQRVERIVIKNARGHAFFEFGEPLLNEPENVWFRPLESLTSEQRESFESIGSASGACAWSEVGSRMMTRIVTGQDLVGPWVTVQDGIYRYAVAQEGVMLVRTMLFEYLATEVYWGA